MTPPNPPPLPPALFKSRPEDFVVEEVPAYEPSGHGDHLFVSFRKTGLDTPTAVRRIAEALDVDPKGAGYAGMKDRHAVAVQRASFPWPAARDAGVLESLAVEGIELLSWSRHPHKLKTGHLRGNRFRVVLRELPASAFASLVRRLGIIASEGVPNAFGHQRFGRDGDNAEQAARWIASGERPPRDRRRARLLFSAWQSARFNEVLARREADGTWRSVLAGDLAHKHVSGGMFLVPEAGPELADAQARAEAGELCPTGPMFGAKMRKPEGVPAAIEAEVLAASGVAPERLAQLKKLGEGTRRPLQLAVDELSWECDAHMGYLSVAFVLPKGGYATTVLSRLVELREPPRGRDHHDPTTTP